MSRLANRKDIALGSNGASAAAAGVEELRQEIEGLQAREAALLVELDYLRQNRMEHRAWGAEERERAAWAHHVAEPEVLRGYLDFLMPPELGEGSAGSRFPVDQLVAAYAESLGPVAYLSPDDEGEGQAAQGQAAQKPDYLEVLDAATREAEAEAAGALARVERLAARVANGEHRGFAEATARYRERLADAQEVLQRAEQRLALRRAERLRIDARLRRLGIRVDATQAPSPDEQLPAQRWWRGYVRENLANLDEPIAVANRMLSRGAGVEAFFEFSMRTRSRWDFVAFDRETLHRELTVTTDINRRTTIHRRIAQVEKEIAARKTPWFRDAQILSETSEPAAGDDDLYWFVIEEARLVASPAADAPIQRAELMRLKGLALMSRQQWDAAIDALDQSVALDPDNARAYNNRGSAWVGKGDYERAIDSFDGAILRDPGNASAFNNMGLAFGGQGDQAAAVAAFDAAIDLHRGDLAAHNNRAFAQRALGNYAAALVDCDAALRLDPACVAAVNNRGITLRAGGDIPGALAAFDQAILLDPSDDGTYNNRALVLNGVGDFDGALAASAIALRLNPRSLTAYNNRAFAYGRKGDFRAAVAASDAALRLDPDNAATWNNRGFALNSLGDYADAVAAYDQAIRLAPGYAIAHSNRGYSCFALGRYDDATESFITTQNLTGPKFGTHVMEGVILLAQGPVTRKGGLRKIELAKQQGLPDDGKLLAALTQFLHSLSRDGQLQRLSETKTLFKQGVRLSVHGLESNIRQAVADAHIDAPWLPQLLAVLAGKADPAILSGWQFWRNVA